MKKLYRKLMALTRFHHKYEINSIYTTEISEEKIKKESAFYEAKCRCEHPDIESDDWYFDYVNEDFIAGYMAALSKSTNGVGDVAIVALKKIANPIQYLQEEAEKEGAKSDGYMAIQLIKDANFYQEIARKALKELNN